MPLSEPNTSQESPIEALEKLKDRIIAAFSASTHRDESTRKIWCGDAKEMYYRVVLVHQILSQGGDPGRAKGMLQAASSRYAQVRSELNTLEAEGRLLEQQLENTFGACRDKLVAQMPPQEEVLLETPPARMVKKSAEEYDLPCCVCGKTAVALHPAGSEEKILRGMICAGVARSVGLNLEDKEKISAWLENGDLAAFHDYMVESYDGGLDAYCPQCDRIYCRDHYNVTEEWDEGFYDCSRGVCPQGHKRMIDD